MIRQQDTWLLEASWYRRDALGEDFQERTAYFSTKRDAEAVGKGLMDLAPTDWEFTYSVVKVVPWGSSQRAFGPQIQSLVNDLRESWGL